VYLNPHLKSLISCIGRSLEVHSELLDRPAVENGVECGWVVLEASVIREAIAF
jgi:hypothetical protein